MKGGGAGKSIRESAAELLEGAAELGIAGAAELLRRTPKEIEMELRAAERRRQAQAEDMDLLAWLAGRYFMLAMHAPKRYPRRPDGIRRRPEKMSDAQMKQVFAAMAAGREEGHGGC